MKPKPFYAAAGADRRLLVVPAPGPIPGDTNEAGASVVFRARARPRQRQPSL